MSLAPAAAIPSHIPPHLVVDIDVFNLNAPGEDLHLRWKRVQQELPELVYTPRNGGHWLATRGALVERLFGDADMFSSMAAVPPLPPGAPWFPPLHADAPEHFAFRSLINPAMSPKALQPLAEMARQRAIELIDGLQPRGECEFIKDFAQHLPIEIFLRMVDLPITDREWLLDHAEVVREDDVTKREQALGEIFGYLGAWIQRRAAQPGNDIFSKIVHGKVGDRPMTPMEVLGECAVVLIGGLDTVASMMGFIAQFLAKHPAHRQQLIDEPALIPQAIEELFRRHGVAAPARVVKRDCEFNGVQLKQGDFFYLGSVVHGLDERVWNDPLTVDFRRDTRGHQTFGNGIHRCPGANLARVEIRIFLEEWLKRIPHFAIKPGEMPRSASGSVNGMLYLPLVWAKA